MKLFILADDFTGALDTGVQLSKNAIRTTVMVNPDTPPALDENCQVLVINANIRHASPEDAYVCICRLLQKYSGWFTHVYIKTDSALRGNVSAALAATADTLRKPLMFIPAFPELGRTTVGATAYVQGKPLEQSVFRDDPRTPATQSHIPTIVNRTHKVECECISANQYQTITNSSLKSDMVYIFDCETSNEMQNIADILSDEGLYGVCAGCAGFAQTFASHLPFAQEQEADSTGTGPALFVSGSANAVTLGQIGYAKEHGYKTISLSDKLFSDNHYNICETKDKEVYKDLTFWETVETSVAALVSGKSVILATAGSKDDLLSPDTIRKLAISEETIHNYIASYTSSLVKSILDKVSITNMVVFGGDMVASILEELGCYQVIASKEIVTGVPLCQIRYQDRDVSLVTKSGGFGDADVIPVIEGYLKNPSEYR